MSFVGVPGRRRTLPRDLHPLAWWGWAVGLAAAATLTTNPLVLLVIVGVVALTVELRRAEHPWSRSFGLYARLGALTVVIRVGYRILLGGYPGSVVLHLPGLALPSWTGGWVLLGPLTREALLSGLYEGLQLATVVICVGAANSLANPKRLLRSLPSALYEVGTALVVAVTVLPQLTESLARVRAAQALRAGDQGRVRRLRRLLVPVLEDTLERSLALAAGMDARGYGRSGSATPAERRRTGALMLTGLVGVCVGVYAGLDSTTPRWLGLPMLAVGLALAAAGLVLAGARVERTVYRPDPWRPAETLTVLAGLASAGVAWWVGHHQLVVAHPGLDAAPTVSALALVGALLGLFALVGSPAPTRAAVDPSARVATARPGAESRAKSRSRSRAKSRAGSTA